MGLFLSLTGVVGKKPGEVVNSLRGYAHSAGGGLEQEALPGDHDNSCVIEGSTGNTTIFYSDAYIEWDESAAFISKDLNAAVFSFHIHDGDFWMYTLFVNGEPVDQFNPIPDYFEDDLPAEEIHKFKGNVKTIATFVPGIDIKSIEKYLVRWDLEKENAKAYPDDEFTNEDWQLVDFMRKLGFTYPVDDAGKPTGQVYKLWTNQLPLQTQHPRTSGKENDSTTEKPWWKFW